MFLGLSSYCRAGDYLGLWGSDSVYSTEWRSIRSKSQRYITHSFSLQKRVAFLGTVSFLHVLFSVKKEAAFHFGPFCAG